MAGCLSTVYALDAKMKFDDNAEFRQKDIFNERDWSQEDPKEVEASQHNLNYIALDGKFYTVIQCLFSCRTSSNMQKYRAKEIDVIKFFPKKKKRLERQHSFTVLDLEKSVYALVISVFQF